jgi:hypothetical protein
MTYNCRTFPKTYALDEKSGIRFVLHQADEIDSLYEYDCMFPRQFDRESFDIGTRVVIVDKSNRTKTEGVVDSFYEQTADHIEKKDETASAVCFRCIVKVESVTQF